MTLDQMAYYKAMNNPNIHQSTTTSAEKYPHKVESYAYFGEPHNMQEEMDRVWGYQGIRNTDGTITRVGIAPKL